MDSIAIKNDSFSKIFLFLKRVPDISKEYQASLFWKKQLEKFNSKFRQLNINDISDRDKLNEILFLLGYKFKKNENNGESCIGRSSYSSILESVEQMRKIRHKLKAESFQLDKDDYEHVRALLFLADNSLLDEYFSFIEKVKLKSDMSLARHWYYAFQVKKIGTQYLSPSPLDILEIGAGAGNLAYILTLMGIVKSYTIIDLPEMLISSSFTITDLLSDAKIYFEDFFNYANFPDHAYYCFLAPQFAEKLKPLSFDLCLNFNSFMEMDLLERNRYIELIYKVAKKRALFYNVNRIQKRLPQRDGSLFYNNPLTYPYQKSDKILVWEDDPFQTCVRSFFAGRTESLAIVRAALINL